MLTMLDKHVTEIVLRLDPIKINYFGRYGFLASLTLWNARMLCLLLRAEWGRLVQVTTDLLSPKI